jgi:uncharacterized damage-inducible protein DinB
MIVNLNTQAQQFFRDQFPNVWERSAAYSLAVAESMPEEGYAFKPDSLAMGFGEQMLHIADNITSLTERISGERNVFYEKAIKDKLDKAQIIAILSKANHHVYDLINNVSDENLNRKIEFRGKTMTIENIFYLLRDHQVHHRGQCVVYLRLEGIKAPSYVGW